MTKEIEPTQELVRAHGSDLAYVVNHSGGKDSTRMLGLVRESFADLATHVVMADTGFEHGVPISAADFAGSLCTDLGLDLTVVPKRTYLKMVEQRAAGVVLNINVGHFDTLFTGIFGSVLITSEANVGHHRREVLIPGCKSGNQYRPLLHLVWLAN